MHIKKVKVNGELIEKVVYTQSDFLQGKADNKISKESFWQFKKNVRSKVQKIRTFLNEVMAAKSDKIDGDKAKVPSIEENLLGLYREIGAFLAERKMLDPIKIKIEQLHNYDDQDCTIATFKEYERLVINRFYYGKEKKISDPAYGKFWDAVKYIEEEDFTREKLIELSKSIPN